MRRAFLVAGVVVAALVALYAAAGYWLAPGLIRDTLVDRAHEAGIDLRVERVETHPFALSVELYDLRASTRAGKPLVYVQRAAADFSLASALSRALVVQRLALDGPILSALPDLAPRGKAAGEPPRVEVREAWMSGGSVALEGLPRLTRVSASLHKVSTLDAEPGRYEAAATLAGGGTLRGEGALRLTPFAADGTATLDGAPLATAWRFLPAQLGKAPDGSLRASLAWRYEDGRLSLHDLDASARLASGGSLRAQGSLELPPARARLQLDGEALPLALLQPLVAGRAALAIAGGTLSGRGRLVLDGEGARYQGSLASHDGRVEDGEGRLLAGWGALEAGELELAFSPFALRAGELAARAPSARIAIDKQGRLNFARLLAGGGESGGGPPDIHLAQVAIADGRIEFSDRSLSTPFGTTVRELAGTVEGISTAPGEAARVRLDGRVGRYGRAQVRGTVDLDAPTDLTRVRARLRNLALPDFTPYAAKFAGYRIQAGRLDAELRYRVDGGRLVGSNQLVFRHLRLGERVESASALDLPVELAVALLTDSKGRIDLAIPVSGNLKDPHFNVGGLLARALGNTLRKIVSAPFRLLASLAGGGREKAPDAVRFDPGSARLPAPAEEKAAQLAQVLGERPQLEVAIRPGYDANADARALERRQGEPAPYALQVLAQERARAVQQALIDNGAPAARVTIIAGRETAASDEGVPTTFELRASG